MISWTMRQMEKRNYFPQPWRFLPKEFLEGWRQLKFQTIGLGLTEYRTLAHEWEKPGISVIIRDTGHGVWNRLFLRECNGVIRTAGPRPMPCESKFVIRTTIPNDPLSSRGKPRHPSVTLQLQLRPSNALQVSLRPSIIRNLYE